MLTVVLLVVALGVLVPVLSQRLATAPRRPSDGTSYGDGASAGILGGDADAGAVDCGDGDGGGDGGCD
jgi:hypothetical protein